MKGLVGCGNFIMPKEQHESINKCNPRLICMLTKKTLPKITPRPHASTRELAQSYGSYTCCAGRKQRGIPACTRTPLLILRSPKRTRLRPRYR